MTPVSLLLQPNNKIEEVTGTSKENHVRTRTKNYPFETLAFIITKHVWLGAIFKNNYRSKENFLERSTLELDYDDGVELSLALSVLAPYKHIIGTTRSHRKGKNGKPPCDRFRVVLFLEQKITDHNLYRPTMEALLKKVGLPTPDPNSFSPTQHFHPVHQIVSKSEYGLEVPVVTEYEPPRKFQRVDYAPGQKGNLLLRTKEFLINGLGSASADGTFYRAFIASAMDLEEKNYSFEESLELLRRVPHTEEYRQRKFEDVYKKHLETLYRRRRGNG